MPVTPQNEVNEENEPPIIEYITAQRVRIYNLAEFALVSQGKVQSTSTSIIGLGM